VYEQPARAADLTAHLRPSQDFLETMRRSLDAYARMQPSLPRAFPSTPAALEKPAAGNSSSPSAWQGYRGGKDEAVESSSDAAADTNLEQRERA
jgi:hypothetical protein